MKKTASLKDMKVETLMARERNLYVQMNEIEDQFIFIQDELLRRCPIKKDMLIEVRVSDYNRKFWFRVRSITVSTNDGHHKPAYRVHGTRCRRDGVLSGGQVHFPIYHFDEGKLIVVKPILAAEKVTSA